MINKKTNTRFQNFLETMKTFAESITRLTEYGSTSKKLIKTSIGIKKEYLKEMHVCRVTFTLPEAAAPDVESVYIVGDFNNWNTSANPMKRFENGDYSTTLDLETGKEYQFLYLIDGSKWKNDWNADKYVKNPYGDNDNSVVMTY
ncbi:MAG: isoamylase early set domain-containing protein [Candidatus Scalindua rubra]|uniref:Glycogen branching enzyme n=1 Tax=Candidatus Scalindua brodae TaxID=237368 RepID=A0A0B0EJP8_9BACT|nr:MAG: glycogen branching enzyme [Candidatus Scalindua brodae]MBZ0107443.1 isoamylase early set domain-containing protein [Candidatus Scalindua rubra]TWU32703.1 glycogen branching enzyme [Candidatus Brocadiaceae bacterium S225]